MVTATDYDPILAQVIQRRLEVICQEAAITLNRTSGSPIVTEANDFSTSLLDTRGETIAFSSYLPPHFVSGMNAIRDLTDSIPIDDVRPGDHFAANDPHTTASLHSADTNVITPLFYRNELVAWAFSDVHVFDIGGLTPGGWIPGAFDRYGEGLHFPVMKVVKEGEWDESFVRIFLANVRLPQSLNDLRSCVAANNTAQDRLVDLLDRYGVETFQEYAAVNIHLSERLARQRIAALRDGTYEATDWVEYDGHGVDGLYRLSVKIVVRGDELLIDLRDSPPQVDGFVNATRAALLGWILGDLLRTLFPDLPINAGVTKPLRMLKPPLGTMLNPTSDAATSGGHMEAGSKVMRAFHEALQKAIQLSPEAHIRRRAAGLGGSVAPHNVVAGVNDDGVPEIWVSLDSLGTGLGAQLNGDGRDAGCYEDMTASMLLDTELEESSSALHFYRRLLPNSGGHGFRRGGLAVDTAWCLYGMGEARVTMLSNLTRVPTRSPGGGYPGSATGNFIFREEEPLEQVRERRRVPVPQDLTGSPEIPPSHATYIPVSTRDTFQAFCAGGCGLGDPLFREPPRVARDVEDELVTADVARRIYGVVLDAAGAFDEAPTAARRKEIRTERLGGEPECEPEPMLEYRSPLRLEGETFACNHCGRELAPVAGSWKDGAATRSWALTERARDLGIWVRPRVDPAMWLWEFYCPSCATLLEVNIYEEGEEPGRDIRLGETSDEQGEAF
jgi:N-methylhydantoinase B